MDDTAIGLIAGVVRALGLRLQSQTQARANAQTQKGTGPCKASCAIKRPDLQMQYCPEKLSCQGEK